MADELDYQAHREGLSDVLRDTPDNPAPDGVPNHAVVAHQLRWLAAVADVGGLAVIDEVAAEILEDREMRLTRGAGNTLLRLLQFAYGGVCLTCGCTDEDCSDCVDRTGEPCEWADEDRTKCTACETLVAVAVPGETVPWPAGAGAVP